MWYIVMERDCVRDKKGEGRWRKIIWEEIGVWVAFEGVRLSCDEVDSVRMQMVFLLS